MIYENSADAIINEAFRIVGIVAIMRKVLRTGIKTIESLPINPYPQDSGPILSNIKNPVVGDRMEICRIVKKAFKGVAIKFVQTILGSNPDIPF